ARQRRAHRGFFHPRAGKFTASAGRPRGLHHNRRGSSAQGIGGARTMAQAEKPNMAKYRERMDKAVAALKEEFGSLRTGRASAGLLDQVTVEAYGSHMPINQVGAISVPEPRSISVSVWDKGLVVQVEKAIRSSGLGLNPVVEGQNLR